MDFLENRVNYRYTTAIYTYMGARSLARSAMIRGASESPQQLIAERKVIALTDVIRHTILLISLL